MKNIEGVPETVTHEQVLAAVRALGFDPDWVRAIRLEAGGTLEVVVHIAKPAALRRDRDDVAVHTLTYLVDDYKKPE